jgi:hypothetical protein
MPGDPQACREFAERCLALSERAWRSDVRETFAEMAQLWKRLAAEHESDQALFNTLSELEFNEPYYALPLALKLHAEAALPPFPHSREATPSTLPAACVS